jgi:hypothetical protein
LEEENLAHKKFSPWWAKNISSIYKNEKLQLLNITNVLHMWAKISPINDDEQCTLRQMTAW